MTDKLSPKQTKAIALLLQGRTIESTAKAVGVSSQAIDDWFKKTEFREQLNQGKDRIYGAVVSRLTILATKAIDALIEVFDDTNTPPSARVAAAKVTLENLARYRAIDLGERLENLEQQIRDMTND